MPTTPKDPVDLTQVKMDLVRCEGRLEALEKRFDERVDDALARIDGLVTRIEFAPIRALVYGMVGILCTSVVGALLARVIVK